MGKIGGETKNAELFSRGPRCPKIIGLLMLCLAILSCSGFPVKQDRPRGIYHRVRSGETLSIIARAYKVDLQELAEINNIENPDRIGTDSVIFIPDAQQIVDDVMAAARLRTPAPADPGVGEPVAEKRAAKGETVAARPEEPKRDPAAVPGRSKAPAVKKEPTLQPRVAEREQAARTNRTKPDKKEEAAVLAKSRDREESAASPKPREKEESISPPKPREKEESIAPPKPREKDPTAEQIQFDKKRFIWPVKGKVVSSFGIQPNRMYNNGIRIAAAEGTAVQAAADGLVIFSAPLKDYGETIIIQHEGQYATVYTHLGIRTVRDESRVRKGDRIAFLGKGENREEPGLHFEVRLKNKARNPLFYLP